MKRIIKFLPGKNLLVAFTMFGALAAIRAYPQAIPANCNFSPHSGLVGTSLVISGVNFSATAASNFVYFGAVRATVSSASTNSLTVTVPPGATYAPVTVTVGGLTAYSGQLFEPTFTGNGSNITSSSFAPGFNLGTAGGPGSSVIADLDGNGKPDIALVTSDNHSVAIFQNICTNGALLGAASFAPRVDLPFPTNGTSGNPYRLRAVDLDGDGKLDLIACEVNGNRVSVFHNVATPGTLTTNSFEPSFALIAGNDTRFVTAADLDGDGRVDIVALNYGDKTISLFKNVGIAGSLNAGSFAPPVVLLAPGGPYEAAIADLDGDGKPDLAVANSDSGTVSVYQNLGALGVIATNSFAPRIEMSGGGGNTSTITVADLDGDGKLDIVSGSGAGDSVNVFRNISSGGLLTTNSFAPRVDFGTPGWMHTVSIADFNGDGKPDICVVGELPSYMAIFQNVSTPGSFTSASLTPRVDFSTGYNAWGITAGDLNGDGRPDIVFCNAYDSNIQIYQNQVPFGAPPPSCTPAPSGLVGWWRGEGNASDSAGTNNGSLSGSGATYATGEVGQGFRFDGTNGYVQIPDSDALKPSNVTLEAWVWLDPNLSANNGGEDIVFKQNTWSAWFEAYCLMKNTIDNGNGTYSDRFQFTVSRYGNQVSINSQTIAQRGVWYHVAATYDGNQSILYVNGVAEASATPGFPLDYGTNPVFIGTSGTWPPYLAMFGGIIDEVSIYNRALSSNEIAAIYNAGGVGKCYAPTAPFITLQPTNQTVTVSNSVTFAVTVDGTPPLNYQWNFNGTNIVGATNSSLTLDNLSPAQAGNYSVLVTNFFGAVTSSNAVLTVYVPLTPPTIIAQSPDQVVLVGGTAIFSVTVSGSDPLSYFWSRNEVLIPGATNSFYILANAQLSDSGSKFSCLVTNASGTAASTNVSLKVIDTISNDLCSGAVVITTASYTNVQSTRKASAFGDPVPDCVNGFGHGVWYQFTAPVAGQLVVDTFGSDFDTGLAAYTGSCDAFTEVACNDDTGGVTSQVILPTTAGTTYFILAGGYSSDAGNLVLHLNHLTPPAFVSQPADTTVVVTSNASFSATLTGALPMGFQWFFNSTPLVDDGRITGSMTANLSIANITTADGGRYMLIATNYLGATNSMAAILTVLTPPVFAVQPVGRSVPPGLPTIFKAVAGGNPLPSYQWMLNGTNISGWLPDSSYTFTIAAVGTNDLGSYQVVASNSLGVITSAVAQLTFGPVAAWGDNTYGECLPPPGLSNVVGIAGSVSASFAILANGTVASWGSGGFTNLPASASNVVMIATSESAANYLLRSDGTLVGFNGAATPVLSNVVSVASGYNFGLALRAEGTLTGLGNITSSTVPTGMNHITAIACGYTHSLALRSDGTVVAWGSGAATNVPIGLANVTAIAAGYAQSLALKSNGTVVAWGSGKGTNLPPGLTNVTAIFAGGFPQGESLSLAIRSNGTVVAWGDNTGYSETNPPAALTNLFSVSGAAAPDHGLALVNDGSPVILHPPVGLTAYTGRDVTLQASAAGAQPLNYQWLLNGTNVPGATNGSMVIPNIQFANAGSYQLFVSNSINTAVSLPAPVNVISNNTLVFLSETTNSVTNYQGSKIIAGGVTVLGSGPLRYQWFFSTTNKNYTAVSSATNDTLVLDPALAVQSGNYYVSVSNLVAGITSAPVNVKVLFARAWGFQAVSNPPVNVTNAIAVATGGYQDYYGDYFALGADGKLTSWANYTPIYGETNVSALSNSFVIAIAAGTQHSLALKSDGTVYAWGYGGYGQTNPPAGLNSVVAVACGGYHDLALKADGTVVGWGAAPQFNYGQATNNPAATNVVAIAAGAQHSLALRADGTVVGWGYSQDGSITIPPTATNVIAIAAGSGFSAALRANGTVVQWGNGLANYPVPANLSNVVAISGSATHCTALRNDGTVVSWGYEYTGPAPSNVPPDLANVIAIASGGDHDIGLFGTRAPAFTIQPWNRAIASTARTNIVLAAKCAGVQLVSYQWQLNGTNVPGATNDVLILTNQPSPQFGPVHFIPTGAYQLIARNAYGVVASKFAKITTFIPLGVALNASNLNWTTAGNAQWFGETNVTHDGAAAARSGGIGALQETILQTTLATNYSGNVTFWWKVSSEQFFDILEFRVNGVSQTNISGEVDWQQVSIPVAAGTNLLQWRYSKDASFDGGQDAGWLDQFAFVPAPPVIISQSASQIAHLNDTVSFAVTATGAGPMTITWFRTNAIVPYVNNIFQMNSYSGSGPMFSDSFVLSSVNRTNNGVYSVSVSNAGGTTYGTNVTLKVLVPQLLGSPTLLPDGAVQLTSTDANGGMLSPSDLANFEAQASADLVNWVTLTNALSLTNGMLQLRDNSGTNWPARFYLILEH